MVLDPAWANPVVTRSKVVLEIASALVENSDQLQRQAKIILQDTASRAPPLCLCGSSTFDGVHEVVRGNSHLAIINPSSALTLAYRGLPPFDKPQPVRVIAVIPSADELVFAVHPRTGLKTFEEIIVQKVPLKISTRGMNEHCIHTVLEQVYQAAGSSSANFLSWGCQITREGALPSPTSTKFKALVDGKIDAIFDEGSDEWVAEVLEAGMTILPLGPATLQKLTENGFHHATLSAKRFPALSQDVPTIDFSGWPIFVHADLEDDLVRRICESLNMRKDVIPWQGSGPLPIERMVNNSPEAPMDVPLHPAAEGYWRSQGYLC